MHISCCACAYQLLCKRTTAVVRPMILTISKTYPIFSNKISYIFQQKEGGSLTYDTPSLCLIDRLIPYFTMSSGWAAVILGNVKIRKADTGTGITDCTIDAFGKANIITYNLSGQRISAQTKGLVIEQLQFANGKKVSRKVIKK